jgi:HTH-type transcriptional regulator/antitoxin HipB
MRLRTPTDVGLTIRERRRKLGLDQRTLAERVGVSRQWIVAVEQGKRRAELGLVLRTLDRLGIVLRADDPEPGARPAAVEPLAGAQADIDQVVEAHRTRRTAPR